MRAIGYFRVSSAAPGSLTEQETAFFRFCQSMGYEPLNAFVDIQSEEVGGYSEYGRMLHYIRDSGKGFLVVVVKNLEQLGDNPREVLRRVLELEHIGARLVCSERDISDPVAHTLEALGQSRREGTLSIKVKRAMQQRAMAGVGLGKPSFGYRIGANGRFEVVPAEAQIVKLIYRLYLEDKLGIRLIARHLNERDIATRRGGRWSMVSIRDILRNRTYLGTYNRFGIRIPGSHPALVSASDFRAVQERLKSRLSTERLAADQPFLLSGIVHCGYCGNRMIGVSRHQSWARGDGSQSEAVYRYYQCQSRTNQSVCDYHTWRADKLEAEVVAGLAEQSIPERLEQLAASRRSHSSPGTETPRLKARLKALEHQLGGYLDRAARGDVSPQQLRSGSGDLLREKADLEERLAIGEAEAKGRDMEQRRWQRIIENLQNIDSKWQSLPDADKRTLLQEVVNRVTVFDDHVEISLKC
ncbi:MAG: recombinase family protein [Chloroflexi bacterium]|nr:recombinase family protein [Chloroflexota bacterium]